MYRITMVPESDYLNNVLAVVTTVALLTDLMFLE
jgi:hypothetical protein